MRLANDRFQCRWLVIAPQHSARPPPVDAIVSATRSFLSLKRLDWVFTDTVSIRGFLDAVSHSPSLRHIALPGSVKTLELSRHDVAISRWLRNQAIDSGSLTLIIASHSKAPPELAKRTAITEISPLSANELKPYLDALPLDRGGTLIYLRPLALPQTPVFFSVSSLKTIDGEPEAEEERWTSVCPQLLPEPSNGQPPRSFPQLEGQAKTAAVRGHSGRTWDYGEVWVAISIYFSNSGKFESLHDLHNDQNGLIRSSTIMRDCP